MREKAILCVSEDDDETEKQDEAELKNRKTSSSQAALSNYRSSEQLLQNTK